MTLWGDKMQVLTDLTLDKLINLYVGIVTHDKKQLIEWDDHRRTPPVSYTHLRAHET